MYLCNLIDKETYEKRKSFAGEKRIMHTVFDMNLPTVVVLRNGFAPLSKPKGEQFDVCAEGRLLMLSAWSYSNEHITLTAWDCQQITLMAQELSHEDIETNAPVSLEP